MTADRPTGVDQFESTLRDILRAEADVRVPEHLAAALDETLRTSPTALERRWSTANATGLLRATFGATRSVVAAVIVALFGGFLLGGVLPRSSEEVVPAAVSPSATATPELLSGVDLVTEEVEPGVYRISDDGVRDLAALDDPTDPYGHAYSLVIGQTGGVWMVGPDRDFFRLGDPASHRWTEEPVLVGDEDIEITPDGTVWSANEWRPDGHGKGLHLMAYDGATWTNEGLVPADGVDLQAWQVEIGPDGSVWTLGSDRIYVRESSGWTPWPTSFGVSFPDQLHISDDGTRWFIGSSIWRDASDWRDGDPAWEAIEPVLPERPGAGTGNDQTAISPNGMVWMHLDGGIDDDPVLARFEGGEWSSWTRADGVPPHIHTESWFGHAMAAANDGSVWLVPGERGDDGSVCDGQGPGSRRGVSRFDGMAWTHHLDGLCIHALAVTPDGTAWIRASNAGGDTDPVELYAIDPENVATVEHVRTEPAPSDASMVTTDTAVRSDLLLGVDLVTEEVEPGVLRVASDGVRDPSRAMADRRADDPISLAAGEDGPVWIATAEDMIRLGAPGSIAWPQGAPTHSGAEDFEVGPDGRLYVQFGSRPDPREPVNSLFVLRGRAFEPLLSEGVTSIEATPDGVLASTERGLLMFDEEGRSRRVGPPGELMLSVAPDGNVWQWDRGSTPNLARALVFQMATADDWRQLEVAGLLEQLPEGFELGQSATRAAAAPREALWVLIGGRFEDILAHHDGVEWQTWPAAPEIPSFLVGDLQTTPDGSVWMAPRRDQEERCFGLRSFDGERWSHYLGERCVAAFDVVPDGTVWVLAGEDASRPADLSAYVILPRSSGRQETDLLRGADLVTEEVEPGVVRALHDGHRTLTWELGADVVYEQAGAGGPVDRESRVEIDPEGRVFLFHSGGHHEVGSPRSHPWPGKEFLTIDDRVAVAAGGTPFKSPGWRPQSWEPMQRGELWAFEDDRWRRLEVAPEAPSGTVGLAADPAGRIFVFGTEGVDVLEPDGWSRISDEPWGSRGSRFGVDRHGSAWEIGTGTGIARLVDGSWERFSLLGLAPGWTTATRVPNEVLGAVNDEGVVWVHVRATRDSELEPFLARFDGLDWSVFGPSEGVPPAVGDGFDSVIEVDPDGAVWLGPGTGVEGTGCDGLARFEGETWTTYLAGHCVYDADIDPEGRVWVVARPPDEDAGGLFIIDQRAVKEV